MALFFTLSKYLQQASDFRTRKMPDFFAFGAPWKLKQNYVPDASLRDDFLPFLWGSAIRARGDAALCQINLIACFVQHVENSTLKTCSERQYLPTVMIDTSTTALFELFLLICSPTQRLIWGPIHHRMTYWQTNYDSVPAGCGAPPLPLANSTKRTATIR